MVALSNSTPMPTLCGLWPRSSSLPPRWQNASPDDNYAIAITTSLGDGVCAGVVCDERACCRDMLLRQEGVVGDQLCPVLAAVDTPQDHRHRNARAGEAR